MKKWTFLFRKWGFFHSKSFSFLTKNLKDKTHIKVYSGNFRAAPAVPQHFVQRMPSPGCARHPMVHRRDGYVDILFGGLPFSRNSLWLRLKKNKFRNIHVHMILNEHEFKKLFLLSYKKWDVLRCNIYRFILNIMNNAAQWFSTDYSTPKLRSSVVHDSIFSSFIWISFTAYRFSVVLLCYSKF